MHLIQKQPPRSSHFSTPDSDQAHITLLQYKITSNNRHLINHTQLTTSTTISCYYESSSSQRDHQLLHYFYIPLLYTHRTSSSYPPTLLMVVQEEAERKMNQMEVVQRVLKVEAPEVVALTPIQRVRWVNIVSPMMVVNTPTCRTTFL